MVEVVNDIVIPKVLILPVHTTAPSVTGASVKGMLIMSGSKLFVVTDNNGTWSVVGDQTA